MSTTQVAQKYDVITYDSDEYSDLHPNGQPFINLFAAASHMKAVLNANGIECVVMGGFAMACRASRRTTTDVDMIVKAKPTDVWRVIDVQPRLIVPDKHLASGVIKVFVQTGPEFDDLGCEESSTVEVDLVFPTAKGTPRMEKLDEHTDVLETVVHGHTFVFKGLDVQYMMQTKLWHCERRNEGRDVFDVQFLLKNYTDEVHKIADALEEDSKAAFLEKESIVAKSEKERAEYRRILKF